ncbi:MAG: response regulator, partial [Desulfobacterales bacterium]|nr:response regulator [Desulfobacterales bacterium]
MTNKILFVDNDCNTLDSYERHLRKQFEIDTAQSGEEGLDIIASKGPYAVVISDLSIPGMDGFQFLSRVKDIAPDCACIVLTGHANLQVSLKAVNE